jgi:Fungal Zn(2)-Cys(6) binuclear cluster domain
MDQGASSAITQQLTPNSSPSDEQNQPSAGAARTLASCDLCRRRKVKCDKGKPCSNCLRARVACVSSTLPHVTRARKVGRRKIDGEILKRIAKLENLVKYLETENDGVLSATPAANTGDAQPTSEMANPGRASERYLKSLETVKRSPKDNLDRYLSSSFWVTLSDEVRLTLFLSPAWGSVKTRSLTSTPS